MTTPDDANEPAADTLEAQPVNMDDTADPRVVAEGDGTAGFDPQRFWSQIFETVDSRSKLVECPEWGPDPVDSSKGIRIEVRSMSAGERNTYVALMQRATDQNGQVQDMDQATGALLSATCFIPAYNDAGEWLPGKSRTRLFRQGDEQRLMERNAKTVDRLGAAAIELAGMQNEEEQATFLGAGE